MSHELERPHIIDKVETNVFFSLHPVCLFPHLCILTLLTTGFSHTIQSHARAIMPTQ